MKQYPRLVCGMVDGAWIPVSELIEPEKKSNTIKIRGGWTISIEGDVS